MFERIFSEKNIESSANYALFAGVFFTIISFVTSHFLFKQTEGFVGVAAILFTVMLSLPIVFAFLKSMDIQKKKTFFQKSKHLFDFYIYFFIGSFVVFFLVSLASPSKVLSSEQLFGSTQSILPQKYGLPPPPIPEGTLVKSIFLNNIYVVIIAFILSLMYGAGSLFLLTLNASIFASTLSNVIRQTALSTDYVHLFTLMGCNMGVLFFHTIPEIIGYLFAALGGGILATSLSKTGLRSKEFKKSSKYASLLLLTSFVVLFIAALIEVYISRPLLLSNACISNRIGLLVATIAIVVVVILMEKFRKKKK